MNKELTIAVIGGGPAGVMAAIKAANNPDNLVYIIDSNDILKTILPTGNGRCNIANYEQDFKKLATNYPRGEKFLLSPLSKFGTNETIDFFTNLGLKLRIQDDNRIFPASNNAADVRKVLLNEVKRHKNIQTIKSKVFNLGFRNTQFCLELNNRTLHTNVAVLSTGSNPIGYKMASNFGHKIVRPVAALCPLIAKEKQFYTIPGTSLQNVPIKVSYDNKHLFKTNGDILFTHTSISGPAILEISSLCASLDFSPVNPLKLEINFVQENFEDFKKILRTEIEKNSKKGIINICTKFTSRYLADIILELCRIPKNTKAAEIGGVKLITLAEKMTSFTFNITERETHLAKVTSGGVSLNEIDNKTMQSKLYPHLYFCGEIMDIDGLSGGFNLQNCWTTGFIAGTTLSNYEVANPYFSR